ncbi:zinc finger protein 780B-like [Cloeon dipterum]|uniref:zinc finger protein 780B-like n=1 Tax=Cloeon dipterum TaxID=197152 RepID=UPI00321F6D98
MNLPEPSVGDENLKTECFFCGKMRRYMFTHLERAHKDLMIKKCESNVCFKYFETEIKKKMHFSIFHQNTHKPPLKYDCQYCADASFSDPVCYICHMRRVHPEIALKCSVRNCVFIFKTDEEVNAHLDAVHVVREQGDVFRCHSCDFKSNVCTNLVEHLSKNHLAVKIIECPTCAEVFFNLSDLKRHEKVAHRWMVCSYCKQPVETLKMDKHVNHECPECMNTLLCAGFLKKHLPKCHGKNKILRNKLKRKLKVKRYKKRSSLKKLKSENNRAEGGAPHKKDSLKVSKAPAETFHCNRTYKLRSDDKTFTL